MSWNNFFKLLIAVFTTVIIALIIFDFGSNEPTSISNSAKEVKYSMTYLNVREKPSTTSQIIKTLNPNQKVSTYGINRNGFIQIYIVDDYNRVGWCSNKYLQDSPLSQTQLEKIEQKEAIEREKSITSHQSNSILSNKYVVKDKEIAAATSKANFDLMMNCIVDGDAQAMQLMHLRGQLILLHKGDIVYLEKATFNYYKVRLPASTSYLYVIGDHLSNIK